MKEEISYGWIGNGVGLRRRSNAEMTKLTTEIRDYLGGKKPSVDVRARNLVEFEGRIIYILCVTGEQWMPYCSIIELMKKQPDLNFCLLLGQDGGYGKNPTDIRGKIWFFENKDTYNIFYNVDGTERLQENGNTFTLPINVLDAKYKQEFSCKEELEQVLKKLIC